MEDYKKEYKLGSIVTAKRTYNGEIITGKFGGFLLLNKSNSKSIVGVVHTPNGSYDVEPDSIESVISKDEKIREEIKIVLANTDLSQFALDYTFADMLAWLEKQGEQKPAWSEEDEKILNTIIAEGDLKPSEIDWLKKRIQPKQKYEWSKEDENLYTLCMSAIKTRYNDGLFTMNEYKQTSLWLESLKERMKGE